MRAGEVERSLRLACELKQILRQTTEAAERTRELLDGGVASTLPQYPASRTPLVSAAIAASNVVPFPEIVDDAVGLFLWDVQSDLLLGDRAIADLFGADFQSLERGMSIMQLLLKVHEEDTSAVANAIRLTLTSSIPFRIGFRGRTVGG